MLRKLSSKIRRKRDPDEFVCVTAAKIEREQNTRDLEAARVRPARASWEYGDEDSFYTNRALEALTLEPIIAPTLRRMGPTVAPREALQPPRTKTEMRIEMPPRAWTPPQAQSSDLVLLSEPIPGVTITPAAAHRANPFDAPPKAAPVEVTQLPRHEPLRRKAVSYRTQRDLPLRVQAVRRAHQEQFTRRMVDLDPVFLQRRRKSVPPHTTLPVRAPEPSLYPELDPTRPMRPLLPEQALRRARSEAHLDKTLHRTHSHGGRPIQPPKRDFYIESAEPLWELPSPVSPH